MVWLSRRAAQRGGAARLNMARPPVEMFARRLQLGYWRGALLISEVPSMTGSLALAITSTARVIQSKLFRAVKLLEWLLEWLANRRTVQLVLA